MMHIPILLFVILPFVEIWLLIWVGHTIGGGLVFVSILASALLGVQMMRHAGTSTLASAREHLIRGEIPGEALLDGAMRLLGGVLLIFPGYLTDLIAMPLILPVTRAGLRRWILSLLERRFYAPPTHPDPASVIIEGEVLSHSEPSPRPTDTHHSS
ncbi:MAG: FxsA family protein [Magnetococcales bacterium]|nr:FxsA family protein [Magnetococcales bacterium]